MPKVDPTTVETSAGLPRTAGGRTGAPGEWRARAGALSNGRFRAYWLGMLAAFAGNQLQSIAQGWLVYSLTGSRLALGGLSAAVGVAMVLFSLLDGALADRLEKMMSFGLMPLGTLPVGAAADAFGAPLAIAGSAVMLIVVTLAILGRWPKLIAAR
jgi:Transmembrane secretion effector